MFIKNVYNLKFDSLNSSTPRKNLLAWWTDGLVRSFQDGPWSRRSTLSIITGGKLHKRKSPTNHLLRKLLNIKIIIIIKISMKVIFQVRIIGVQNSIMHLAPISSNQSCRQSCHFLGMGYILIKIGAQNHLSLGFQGS